MTTKELASQVIENLRGTPFVLALLVIKHHRAGRLRLHAASAMRATRKTYARTEFFSV
jgi:hypothetical protein